MAVLAPLAALLVACGPAPTPAVAQPTANAAIERPEENPIVAQPEATPAVGGPSARPTAPAPAGATPRAPSPAGPAETSPAVGPTTRDPSTAGVPVDGYERAGWRHWIDADHDCQSTRHEVLIAESEIPVTFWDERGCKVDRGRWTCPYTGEVFTEAHELDVDHLVPLAEAHRSGGHAWDAARRQAFANELGDPAHLVAVSASANREKGSRGPEAWLPATGRCAYIDAWVAIKRRWGLSVGEAEAGAIAGARRICERGGVPELPGAGVGAVKAAVVDRADDPPRRRTEPPRRCCRVCRTGRACGDGCIARTRTCNKGPGCACDG